MQPQSLLKVSAGISAARSPQAHSQGGNTMSRLEPLEHKLNNTDILTAMPANRDLEEKESEVKSSLLDGPNKPEVASSSDMFNFRARQETSTQLQTCTFLPDFKAEFPALTTHCFRNYYVISLLPFPF